MIQIFSIIFSISFVISTIYAVRNRELHFAYAVLWILLGFVILSLALEVGMWNKISSLIGIYYAPAFVFLVAILFILVYIFRLTITVTKLGSQNVILSQEIAILKVQLKNVIDRYNNGI